MSLPKIYLAGKIRKNCWRHRIVRNLRGQAADGQNPYVPLPEWPILHGVVLDGLGDYVGPYFLSCDHGCAHAGPGSHALTDATGDKHYSAGCISSADGLDLESARSTAVRLCREAVSKADVVFAYIEEPSAYGTLVEIGWAHALDKKVWTCFGPGAWHDDFWFTAECAEQVRYAITDPAEVLRQLLTPKPIVVLESEAERRFWTAHTALALPELTGLVTQHPVSNYRMDFALPERMIGIEIDGHAYHSDREVFTNDRIRQRRLEKAGWRIIRFSGREACNTPDQCVREAAELVRTAHPELARPRPW